MEFHSERDFKISNDMVFQAFIEDASKKLLPQHKVYADYINAGKAFEENGRRATAMTGDTTAEKLFVWDAVACYVKAKVMAGLCGDIVSVAESVKLIENSWSKLNRYAELENAQINGTFQGHASVLRMILRS